jgi:hypothetical protein
MADLAMCSHWWMLLSCNAEAFPKKDVLCRDQMKWRRIVYRFLACTVKATAALLLDIFSDGIIRLWTGPHDSQTVGHVTCFCGDFLNKECTATNKEAWKTLNITMNTLLPALFLENQVI